MQVTLFTAISKFDHLLQEELFPRLVPAIGENCGRHALFIATCAMVPFARYLPCGQWSGRPSRDRLAIARAFLAKGIFGDTTTRPLFYALCLDKSLRRLPMRRKRNRRYPINRGNPAAKKVQRQLEMSDPSHMLAGISTQCDIGAKLNHRPIIQPQTRPKPKTQLPG